MIGRFQITTARQGEMLWQSEWINNKIYRDFPRLLAQALHDFMGNSDKLSKLADHGFYMAVGPGGREGEEGIVQFKEQIEIMEREASKPNPKRSLIQKGNFQGRTELLYTPPGRKYYAIELNDRDLSLRERELFLEATLAEKNPKTNGLKIGEFGIYTKYPAASENIFLLNYGRHSEIRKDNDLTLSRKIEFVF